MKFETNLASDVVQVGDISKNSVSLDVNNIDFIVTILSTNLYSKPIESFIRETASNAWDSHTEAGVDEPVILELLKDPEGDIYCRIQDFGVGLSPERFNNIYKMIGSSTKRDDNKQIGGFGIGRFSALAYSDVVHLTSVYEGKKYIYMMYKDGNSISIDMLHSMDTDERNGFEVKLQVKEGDYNNFCKAIKSQLVYFENLYVIAEGIEPKASAPYFYRNEEYIKIAEDYNSFSIKKFDNFWVNSLDETQEISLLLGKVRYPLRVDNLGGKYPQKVKDYPISLVFEIGDLAVTPNREEILYNDKNQKTIIERLDTALAEIEEIVKVESTKDYTTIVSYLEAIEEKGKIILLEGKNNIDVKVKVGDFKRNLTLNGVLYDPHTFHKMSQFFYEYCAPISEQYYLSNQKIKYTNEWINLAHVKKNFGSVFIADFTTFNNMTKRYIRETFPDGSIFIRPDKVKKGLKKALKELKEHVDQYNDRIDRGYAISTNKKIVFDIEIFKLLVHNTLPNLAKIPVFTQAKVPQIWIDKTKAADKAKRGKIKKVGFDWSQNVNVHELRYTEYGNQVTTDSKPYKLKDLAKISKKLTLYAPKGDPASEKLRLLYVYFKQNVRPNMVEIAPSKIKLVKNVDNYVNKEDFMSTEHKLFRNIATVQYLNKVYPKLNNMAEIENMEDISPILAETLDTLKEFKDTYGQQYQHSTQFNTLLDEIYDVAEVNDYFNEEIRGLFLKHQKELEAALFLLDFVDYKRIPKNRVNLLVDYVLARKVFKPSIPAVVKAKKETIYNIKEEQDENS